MAETWYVLDDGGVAAPEDVRRDDAGMLKHKDGRGVAYAPHGPRTRSVDAEAERAKAAPPAKAKDMKPDTKKPGYQTRESKADC